METMKEKMTKPAVEVEIEMDGEEKTPVNRIALGEGTFDEMEEGQEVEATVKGTLVKKPDGSMCLEANMVNGVAVAAEVERTEGDIGNDLSKKLKQREKMQLGMDVDEDEDYA